MDLDCVNPLSGSCAGSPLSCHFLQGWGLPILGMSSISGEDCSTHALRFIAQGASFLGCFATVRSAALVAQHADRTGQHSSSAELELLTNDWGLRRPAIGTRVWYVSPKPR
jgi:hypothetical protein